MRDGPVAVGVGDELTIAVGFEFNAVFGVLRHVRQDPVGVRVHRLRQERQRPSKDANRVGLAWSPAGRSVDERARLGLVSLLYLRVDGVLLACGGLVVLHPTSCGVEGVS
eukprot:1824068-Pleurochrysis_carterae.AAC.1